MRYLLLIACTLAFAWASKDYAKGLELYKQARYKEAFPLIFAEAQEDNRAAQYRLAQMYEDGLGVEKDSEQAMFWYKLSSNRYSYIDEELVKEHNTTYMDTLEEQVGDSTIRKSYEYYLAKVDTSTPETKQLVKSVTGGNFFGLQPYQTNYFLPFSYGKDKPLRHSSAFPQEQINQVFNDPTYDSNLEAEFQFSLKKQLSYDLFGWNEMIFFAYTQKVWWQIYIDSAPFRETNYLPEVFMVLPSTQYMDDTWGVKAFKFGFLHESNGQEGYRSRSWNRLYATVGWQWGNLFLATRAWYRLKEDEKPTGYYDGLLGPSQANAKGDDNPDIDDYLGYGDIKIQYLNGQSQYGLLLRNNLRLDGKNKGAVEMNYSYPLLKSPNTFVYVKLFHGYGESLIDYDRKVSKASIGFSFSRELF